MPGGPGLRREAIDPADRTGLYRGAVDPADRPAYPNPSNCIWSSGIPTARAARTSVSTIAVIPQA